MTTHRNAWSMFLLIVLLAAFALAGCKDTPSAADVEWQLEHLIPGLRLERESHIRIPRIAMVVARKLMRMLPDEDKEDLKLISHVKRVNVATYRVVSSPSASTLEVPARFEKRLTQDDWELVVRQREDDEYTRRRRRDHQPLRGRPRRPRAHRRRPRRPPRPHLCRGLRRRSRRAGRDLRALSAYSDRKRVARATSSLVAPAAQLGTDFARGDHRAGGREVAWLSAHRNTSAPCYTHDTLARSVLRIDPSRR